MAPNNNSKSSDPKDGWKAFVVAVCASILQAVVLGVNNSFPNFLGLMLGDSDLNTDSSMLSLVQACGLGFAGLLAVPAGFVVARFGSRISSIIASVALIVCMVITSAGANSGESMIGLYSVPMGIAVAFMMSPGATATSSWFDKHAALGMGICFTGGGTGSLAIPRIAGALAKSLSWRNSFYVLAALGALGLVSSFFICVRPSDEDEEGDEGQKRASDDAAAHDREAGTATVPIAASPTGGPAVVRMADHFRSVNGAAGDVHVDGDEANEGPSSGTTAAAVTVSAAHRGGNVGGVDRPFNYHTDKATTAMQLVKYCLLTRNFLALFFTYGTFSVGFYALLYAAVPYPQSMGTPGTPYADYPPISVDDASNVFVSFGILQTIWGPFIGWVATKTDERLVFIGMMGVMIVASAYYTMARALWDHIGLFAIFGAGSATFFATFGTMVAQRYWGPNLSVIMSSAFTGVTFGGFLGSTVSTEIVKAHGGSYHYVTVLMCFMFLAAGLLVMFVVQDVEDSDANQDARIRREEGAYEQHRLLSGGGSGSGVDHQEQGQGNTGRTIPAPPPAASGPLAAPKRQSGVAPISAGGGTPEYLTSTSGPPRPGTTTSSSAPAVAAEDRRQNSFISPALDDNNTNANATATPPNAAAAPSAANHTMLPPPLCTPGVQGAAPAADASAFDSGVPSPANAVPPSEQAAASPTRLHQDVNAEGGGYGEHPNALASVL